MRMARKVSCICALGLFGLAAACSDPVAPASQAAVSLYLTTNAKPGVACPASPHWVNVPFKLTGGQQVFANRKGDSAVDNQDQMSVSCTVKDNGGMFTVNATLKSPASMVDPNDPMKTIPINPTNITLQIPSIGGDQPATGVVTVLDDKTASPYSSTDDMGRAAPGTCTFSAHPLAMGDQLSIAAGRVWASVNCPNFRDPSSSNLMEVCSISSGYIVLENCAQ
jgi:hypothetical protein